MDHPTSFPMRWRTIRWVPIAHPLDRGIESCAMCRNARRQCVPHRDRQRWLVWARNGPGELVAEFDRAGVWGTTSTSRYRRSICARYAWPRSASTSGSGIGVTLSIADASVSRARD